MNPQPPVQVWTLRPFAVQVNGEPLTFSRKAPRKPLELLKVLIALGGEGVSEQLITDAVWPDADGDAAHQNFASAVHRLRGLIGARGLRLHDSRVSLAPEQVRVDALEFAALQPELARVRDRSDPEAGAELLSRALDLYRAPFLEGVFAPPEILVAREKLHSQFLSLVEEAIPILSGAGRHEEACRLLERSIQVDGLAESLHRLLIRCRLEQGHVAEARIAWDRCQRLLREAAGLQPSAETQALASQIESRNARRVPSPPFERAPVLSGPGAGPTPGAGAQPTWPGAEAGSAPAGERRHVTILVARWRPLTGPAGDAEAQDRERTLLRNELLRCVEPQGGLLTQLGPECGVAVFSLPAAHEDDPTRAVRAALALARAAGPDANDEPDHAPRFHLGVETGQAVVHPGAADEGRYRLTGAPCDLALLLASEAAAGEVLIGPETSRRTSGYIVTEPAAREGAPPAQRVLGASQARSLFEAAQSRGLTPFTGRQEELGVLTRCLEGARSGKGQIVTVTGEAGLGKSRLVYEFKRQTRERHGESVALLEGRCQSYGGGTPYLPLLDALRRGLDLRETDDPESLGRKAVDGLLEIEPALERFLPLLLRLLSIPDPQRPLPPRLEGEALRRAFEEALAAVVSARSRSRPTVLIYEDWHWADEASESALRGLIELAAQLPLLLILVHRPEYQARWASVEHHQPLVLKRLGVADSAALLGHKLRASDVPEKLASKVHEVAGGNPFFVEEIAESLLADGSLAVEEGRARLTRQLSTVHLPSSVDAVVRSRVDRLPPDAQEALRWAAVIGREFNRRILESVYASPSPLPDCLDRLAAADLVRQARVLPEPEYLFKHVLAQAAVYDSLLTDRRKAMHARVGQAIETLFADRLEEHFEALAHHYSSSDQTEKAIEYLEKAGDKAAGVFSLGNASRFYRQTLALLDSSGESERVPIHAVDVTIKWARASPYVTSQDNIDALLQAARKAENSRDDARLAELLHWAGQAQYWNGRPRDAMKALTDANRLASALGDARLITLASNGIARTCYLQMDYAKGIKLLEEAIPEAKRRSQFSDLSYSLGILSTCEGFTGKFEQALSHAREAQKAANVSGDLMRQSASHAYFSLVHMCRGDWDEVIDHCAGQMTWAEKLGNASSIANPLVLGGYAMAMRGNSVEGIERLSSGIRLCHEAGFRQLLVFYYSLLADAHASLGQVGAAQNAGRIALDLSRDGNLFGVSIAHRALGMAEAKQVPPDWMSAVGYLRDSVGLSEAHGEWPVLAVTRLRFAELFAARGLPAEANRELAAANRSFGKLGMKWWRGQAKRAFERMHGIAS